MPTSIARYACELDLLPDDRAVQTGRLDPAPTLGAWSNTNYRSLGISHAELLRRRDGGLDVRIIGTDPPDRSHDWGRASSTRLFTDGPGSSRVCAYTATFELAHARTEIQAEVKHGLTIAAAFTSFTDGSGRANYYSREFLTRPELPTAPDHTTPGPGATQPAAVRGEDRLPMLRESIDPAPLLSRWSNTDQTSRGITELSCQFRDGQLQVGAVAVGPEGPIDWGEVAATLYTDISVTGGGRAAVAAVTDGRPTPHYADISVTDLGPAFWVTYDHGFQRVHVQARINLGVLVVVVFTEFTDDSGRADYVHREFFIRQA